MTEAKLRSSVANWLVPYLGISEGSMKHQKILDTFNNSKLCSRYKMTKYDAWCATSVSAAFIANGLAGKPGSGKLFQCVECSCNKMIELAKKQGIWVEKDNYKPKVGDLIMYDWDDNGNGENTAAVEHVGAVCSVSGNSFKVIEGNMGNGTVGYRSMIVNGRYIRGFIAPDYAKFATKSTTKKTESSKDKTTTTKKTESSKDKNDNLNKTSKFKGTAIKNVNMRSGAGTKYDKISIITKGTKVDVCDTKKDKNGDDWYYVKVSGKYGFISADYISKKTATKTTKALNKTCKFKGKVIAKNGVNVREWAGVEYDKLRALAKGVKVEVCDSRKSTTGKTWYYIKNSGKYGFVSSEYIARI